MNNDEKRRRLRRLKEERQMRANGGAAGFENNVTAMSNSAIAHEIANIEAILPRRRRTPVKKKKYTKSERWEAAAKRLNARLKFANLYLPSQFGIEKHKKRTANYRNKALEATLPRTRLPPPKRRRPGVSRSASSSRSNNSANNLRKGFSEFNLETLAGAAGVRRRTLTRPRTAMSGVSSGSNSSQSRASSVGSRSRSSTGSRTPSSNSSNSSRNPSRA